MDGYGCRPKTLEYRPKYETHLNWLDDNRALRKAKLMDEVYETHRFHLPTLDGLKPILNESNKKSPC